MSATDHLPFSSRRSAVLLQNGAVACDQPLAAQIGRDILKAGGNAADAAVGVAAALALTEPCSTGLGGDAFALFHCAKEKKVYSVNGSGRAPAQLDLAALEKSGYSASNPLPPLHGHCVTVPGAAAAWADTVTKYGSGKLSMAEILQPAIALAEGGFPLTQITAYFWNKGSSKLKDPKNRHGKEMLIEGESPKWGQVFKNPTLADTFKSLAQNGKKGFYEGRIAQAIAAVVQEHGGVMSEGDLGRHESTFEEPISVEYHGVRLWEVPPSTQGIVALMALSILRHIDVKDMSHNSAEYLHTVIEAIRLSFHDAQQRVADPSKVPVPIEEMISAETGKRRSQLIDPKKAISPSELSKGDGTEPGRDTTYFSVVDGEGNACSFINSNYMGFGTGIVPEGCGFTLQNRGFNFSLDPSHPNVVAPNKRPYHTIIPAMLTDDKTGELLSCYGVMGGFMQPQGHVQVLLNMLHFGMDPQAALDAPRFCVGPGHAGPVGAVSFEEGIPEYSLAGVREKGHEVSGPVSGHGRALFGRGHVITRGAWWAEEGSGIHDDVKVLWAGTDPRADGTVCGY